MNASAATPLKKPDLREIDAFLFHEAQLLDDGRLREWLQLFDADGEYWLPAARDQRSPLDHVSHIYENALLREIRVERFFNPAAPSLQPMPRSSHLVSNIRLGDHRADDNLWPVRSRFVVAQLHRGQQTLFTGEYLHQLRWTGAEFRIKQKRVELVNCDGVLGDIVVYI